jgi:hypothetical protein
MKVSGIILSILILGGFCGPRCGATVYHSNGTAESVQFIHNNQAQNGDTITLPVGTFVWTTGVTITKGITLQGQTTTDSTNGTAVDNTVIRDSNARRRPGGFPFIDVESQPGKSYRITGLTFDGGGATTINYNGIIVLAGNSHAVRVDHCNFKPSLTKEPTYVAVVDAILGVADHNVMIGQVPFTSFSIYMPDWPNPDGSAGQNGDGSFATPTNFGTEEFWFIEDNYIKSLATSPTGGPDDLRGGRWVFRHNHLYDAEVQSHGTEDGRWRGGRAREVYGNDFHNTTAHGVGGVRSGVTVLHDNTFHGVAPGQSGYQLQAYRSMFKWPACPFAGATGDNPWDENDPHGLYDSGTCTTGSNRNQIVDATKNWATNQYAGYTAKFPGNNQVALIQSNTSNTLDVFYYTDSGGGHVWQAGHGYEIHKLLIALDQPGRGQGDLIVGNPPINSRTGTAAWPNQALEPTYSWQNIYTPNNTPVNITVGTGGPMLVEGRDYFNNATMPGYTPYVYPHPLVSGSGSGRAAVIDFNSDGHPDYVLQNPSTHQTAIWYLNNNVFVNSADGPTLPGNWRLNGVADFNGDSHADYALFSRAINQTAIWYMSGPTVINGVAGPALPGQWGLVATADFNGDGHPDYVLYNAVTHQTAIWYLNLNALIGGAGGPILPNGWNLIGVADFDRDGHMDYALFHPATGHTAIWYMSGPTVIRGAWGPTVPSGWVLVATADFNSDGQPDYVLYNAVTRQTAIWYLHNNIFAGGAFGPTLPAGWSLVGPSP